MQLSTLALTGAQEAKFRREPLRMRYGVNLQQRCNVSTRRDQVARSSGLRHVSAGKLISRSGPLQARRMSTVCEGSAGCGSLVEECSASSWNKPLAAAAGVSQPVCVALGKFDGMHQGHRLLAQQAASNGSSPFLLSFSGMAEVLGWPARLPLVAASDRARVLASWTTHCHGRTPRQRYIPFAMVRNLSPEAFVQTLVQDLQVSGVVVGQNYRFG